MSLLHQIRFAELSGDDTVPALAQELVAAGVVENTPTMIEAEIIPPTNLLDCGVFKVAPQGLPATFAMDAEDTESLASRNSAVAFVEDMGGDVPVNNWRLRLVWDRDQDVPPEVRTAANLISTLATWRHARDNQATTVVPLNVPVMWEAARQDEMCPLVEWLISVTSAMAEPMRNWLDGPSRSVAIVGHWISSGVVNIPPTRPGNHITTACSEDARVALLESVFVSVTLEEGRAVRIRRSDGEVPIEVPSGSWALMDQVDLEEEFLRRTPMLRLPPFLTRSISPQPLDHVAGKMSCQVGG